MCGFDAPVSWVCSAAHGYKAQGISHNCSMLSLLSACCCKGSKGQVRHAGRGREGFQGKALQQQQGVACLQLCPSSLCPFTPREKSVDPARIKAGRCGV